MAGPGAFKITGIEPAGAAWDAAAPAERARFYFEAGKRAVVELRGQLLEGKDRYGRRMPPRVYPRADAATGPVLSPHETASRSWKRLRSTPAKDGVVLWWSHGWGRILSYHGEGLVIGAPARDVRGLAPARLAALKKGMAAWWAKGHPDAKPAPKPKAGPKPAVSPVARPVPASSGPILPGRPIGERVAAYVEGDRKVAAIVGLARTYEETRAVRRKEKDGLFSRIRDEIEPEIDRLARQPKKNKEALGRAREELAGAKARFRELVEETTTEAIRKARDLKELLRVADPIRVEARTGPGDLPAYGTVEAAGAGLRARIDEARDFLGAILKRGDSAAIGAAVGQAREGADQRAYYSNSENFILLAGHDRTDVAIHEFGHAIEYRLETEGVPVVERSQEFLAHRVGSEPARKLNEIFPGSKYGDNERGRKDKFDEAFGDAGWYVGKDYGRRSTEILSMGLQKLYEDPLTFAEKDPEYLKYVLGILDGSLR